MNSSVDIVQVKFGKRPVGKLALNKRHVALFEYDKQWLENGFSISPIYLPLESRTFVARSEPFDGLFGVFNDSLPDGWGRLLIDRYLRNKGKDPWSVSVLDRLSMVGKNGMGALSYFPENQPGKDRDNGDLDYFASEVSKILHSEKADDLEVLIAKNGSSAGVRPKVIIDYQDDAWLVKFPALHDPPEIGEIEYECSVMARQCGIETPDIRLFQGKYFGSKLFDRIEHERFHVHSVSGLLYADHRLPSLDYEDVLKLTHLITGDFQEVERMFNRMVFNLLIKNRDDHAKNFSFIYREGAWKLAPAYDLTPGYGFNGHHSTTVLGKGNPLMDDVILLAKKIGFREKTAREQIVRNQDLIQSNKRMKKILSDT
ncbi:MAG: type II toxin-antitoxin system HipA family toxin [Bacteroidales bacterium]